MGNAIARKVIELAVSTALKDFSRGGPPKALAKLFRSGDILPVSEIPEDLRLLIESLLSDPQHPYYAALSRAASGTDRAHFTDFVVNLGYEGISCGGGLLRQEMKKSGSCPPWMLGVPLPSVPPDALRVPVSMGIQCYVLLAGDAGDAEIRAMCRAWPQAAFFAALPDARISESLVHALRDCRNLFFLPVVRGLQFHSGSILHRDSRLYAPLFLVGDAEIDRILQTGVFTCPDDPDIFLGLYLPCSQVTADRAARFTDFMLRVRLHPQVSMVPVLPANDVPGIQQLVTGKTDFNPSALFPALLNPDAALAHSLESML